jgi:alpha-L-fucosidase
MQWWHAAKFGMFIHWGLYSVHGRHEWAMEDEAIPIDQYMQFAKQFKPKPNAPRDFARLAKAAGQKYMVMTTKHHEGFCNWDTKLTNYCATKQGPGRDLVREYVEAVRAEGLHVGFYYSLMDWHHPDGARCATDEAARRRFVDYTHVHLAPDIIVRYCKPRPLLPHHYRRCWITTADYSMRSKCDTFARFQILFLPQHFRSVPM